MRVDQRPEVARQRRPAGRKHDVATRKIKGVRTFPISPWPKEVGRVTRVRAIAAAPIARRLRSNLSRSARWLSPTAFGVPVVPDVTSTMGQLVDMPGRIFRPWHCFTIIQTMGIDAWNCMTGLVGNRDGRLNKANQRAQFVFGNVASSNTATAPHDQTASRSATKPALLP
jgi:hypothetical protein